MLKGTRDGLLKKVQPVSIHGQVSWDVFFTDVEDPDGQITDRPIGSEAVAHNLEARRSDSGGISGWRRGPRDASSTVTTPTKLRTFSMALPLSIRIDFRSMRVFGASPVARRASIASTTLIPSTTRANAV